MELQYVFGPSGAGKSYFIYEKIIAEAIKHPERNFIILVPEQYSMAIQRQIITMHPRKGSQNIDVIGFNRLTYRIFEECNYKPSKILEDFGKTMLLRKVAGEVKAELTVYGSHIGKSGFIDEAKSLMSEFYQYDVPKEKIKETLKKFQEEGKEESILYRKIKDLVTIFDAFEQKIKDDYIVAEDLTSILASKIEESDLIKKSVICVDAFTGFTPSQLKVIRKLMRYAEKTYMVLTMDKYSYERKIVRKERILEHDIFYLTGETIDAIDKIAYEERIPTVEPVCIGFDEKKRWDKKDTSIDFLEKNIFRYPYDKYIDKPQGIEIVEYENPRKEIDGIAYRIWDLVKNHGYRYRDIAVICGNLEGEFAHIDQTFPLYNIPYFLDYSRPVKNNAYIDAIGHLFRIVKENYSHDSIFAFLKSGVFTEIEEQDIEEIENYVLKFGVRGKKWWNREFDEDIEEVRLQIVELLTPFCDAIGKKEITGNDYIKAIEDIVVRLGYKEAMEEDTSVYDKLMDVLNKIKDIMGDDIIELSDFMELIDLGLKDLSYGVIPATLDMVVVGDITRSRLADVKVLFIANVNDGIIPSSGNGAKLIIDSEKEKLKQSGIYLAPTDTTNSCIQQFYLYLNMTKPSDRLFMSYAVMSSSNENLRPSYIISRVRNIFPKLSVAKDKHAGTRIGSKASTLKQFTELMRDFKFDNKSSWDECAIMYKLFTEDNDDTLIDTIWDGLNYNNMPATLKESVMDLLRLRIMTQSVTKLEKYANCAYSYFLENIIGLRERPIREITNMSIGTIMHDVMERVYKYLGGHYEGDWNNISVEERDKLAEQFSEVAFLDCYGDESLEDNVYVELLGSIKRIAKRTCEAMARIDAEDVYKPKYFEHKFEQPFVLSEDLVMKLVGRVDRGDVKYDKATDTLKLRVVDYKTGEKDFDIVKLYDGVSLQLSLYTNILLELAKSSYKNENGEKPGNIEADGMYFYHIFDPFVSISDESKLEAERSKKLKFKGLDKSDGKMLEDVLKFTDIKVKEIAKDILKGNIDISPMADGDRSACEYCPLVNACRFDELGGNKSRRPSYPGTKDGKARAYAEIVKELGGEA